MNNQIGPPLTYFHLRTVAPAVGLRKLSKVCGMFLPELQRGREWVATGHGWQELIWQVYKSLKMCPETLLCPLQRAALVPPWTFHLLHTSQIQADIRILLS